MALSKDQKQAQVADLQEKMAKAKSIIFTHYIGLNVAQVSEFRGKLLESGAEMKVAKKTLTRIAAAEAGLPELTEADMPGPISLIFSYNDAISGAQVAHKFGKENDQVQIVGGIFDGKVISKQDAVSLAQLPSRDILLATFMGMIQSPLRSFAFTINSPLNSFARMLKEGAADGKIGTDS